MSFSGNSGGANLATEPLEPLISRTPSPALISSPSSPPIGVGPSYSGAAPFVLKMAVVLMPEAHVASCMPCDACSLCMSYAGPVSVIAPAYSLGIPTGAAEEWKLEILQVPV